MSLLRHRLRRHGLTPTGHQVVSQDSAKNIWLPKTVRELVASDSPGPSDSEWEDRLKRAFGHSPPGVLPLLYIVRGGAKQRVQPVIAPCAPVDFSPEQIASNLIAEDCCTAIPLDRCGHPPARACSEAAAGNASKWVWPVRTGGELLGFWIGKVGPDGDPRVLAQLEELNEWIAVSRELADGVRADARPTSSGTAPLARWLAADSLMSLCTLAWSDFRKVYGISHLLIVAHGGGWPLGWALMPRDDRARIVDEWFAARVPESVLSPQQKQPVCPMGSASLPEVDPALRQAGFQAGASIETGRSTSYCVFWGRAAATEISESGQTLADGKAGQILGGDLWGQLQVALVNMARMEYLRDLSHIDSITMVFNRRYFNLRLTEETSRARRSGRPLSLLVFDIDRFKGVNDSLGHQAGDSILRRLAEHVRWTVRSTDLLCRLSGDEFAILMPDTDSADCQQLGERLRTSLRRRHFATDSGSHAIPVEVSIGAVFPRHADNAETILWCADMALLGAKQQGRDRFVLYDPSLNGNGCSK
jgi:diguanylate cyclase (GGDEF)-like protein